MKHKKNPMSTVDKIIFKRKLPKGLLPDKNAQGRGYSMFGTPKKKEG